MVIGDSMQAMTIKELRNKYTSSNVMWGRANTKTLSTELDSSTIVITNSDKLDIQAYDIVELTNEYSVKEYWLIADKKEEYTTFTAPFKYQYTIELMSLTKFLETITLPNMTITNIGQNRTIYFYISNVINRYFKTSYGFNITIASRLQSKTNVSVKENTFSEPTLREYLDWLLSAVGAICTLRIEVVSNAYTFVLDYLDLSGSNTAITTSYITDIFTGQDSDSYVSRILHTSDDIVSEQTITEYLKESTKEPILNTDTAQLRLSRKAYDFKSLKALNVGFKITLTNRDRDDDLYDSSTDDDVPNTLNVDITDLVVNSDEYSTLTTPNPSDYNSIPKAYYTVTPNKYITNVLKWDRESNVITNIHYMQQWKYWWVDYNASTSIENALRRKIWEWFKTNYPNKGASGYTAGAWEDGIVIYNFCWWTVEITNYSYDTQLFEVKYQPYYSPKIVEQHNQRNAIYSIDSNTNAKTDILLHLDRSKEKLNQLACDYKIMTAFSKVTNNDYTPKIEVGQYWLDDNNNKYVLTKLETVIDTSCIQYKGTLSLNFSNSIINTQLNREKRYYAYANTETVVRKENVVKTFKVCLSNTSHSAIMVVPADTCRIDFISNNVGIGYYLLPVVKVYNDRMISFEIQTADNISITSVKGDSITGGYQNKVLKYVDANAEFDTVNVDFGVLNPSTTVESKSSLEWASGIDISACGYETSVGGVTAWIDESSALFKSTLTNKEHISLLKDNREQFNLTVQYIFKTENLIQNSDAILNIHFDKFIENLELYYKAFIAGTQEDNSPFTYIISWINPVTEESEELSGGLTLMQLFNIDFWNLASVSVHTDVESVQLLILGDYITNGSKVVVEIDNYKGGLLAPYYEEFI